MKEIVICACCKKPLRSKNLLKQNKKLRERLEELEAQTFTAYELGILEDCLLQMDWANCEPDLRKKLRKLRTDTLDLK